ncbi:MAG TPA: hypothetical protein VFG04_17955 [Planctomycetaceae bacterium]|jgi:hypothetical protein|nr:hypothetical protein [Planctomycetaceae bacterium]
MSDEPKGPDWKRRGAGGHTTIVFATAVLFFVVYMGAYYALLDGKVRSFTWAEMGKPLPRVVSPTYRNGTPLLERFLAPAHEIDRKLRPAKWPAP